MKVAITAIDKDAYRRYMIRPRQGMLFCQLQARRGPVSLRKNVSVTSRFTSDLSVGRFPTTRKNVPIMKVYRDESLPAFKIVRTTVTRNFLNDCQSNLDLNVTGFYLHASGMYVP